ncbi:MAG: hypothetical protein P4L33_10485 [Capsulimonadaceae bacterium]|nr:hypothetical protein [Capsulimonadaceae bacterium]
MDKHITTPQEAVDLINKVIDLNRPQTQFDVHLALGNDPKLVDFVIGCSRFTGTILGQYLGADKVAAVGATPEYPDSLCVVLDRRDDQHRKEE